MRLPRTLLTMLGAGTVAALPANALATSEPPTSDPAETTEPGTIDDAVVEITYEGGFVPPEVAFINTPALVVTADGRVVVHGAVPDIFPGPLVPVLVQINIDDEGVQAYLELAEEHGLLEDRSYERNPLVADAPSTVVRIRVGDHEFVHSAYALGFDGERDPDRAELYAFVTAALDPGSVVPADVLGPDEPFEFDSYLIMASVSDEALVADVTGSVIVEWPGEIGLRLAEADECAEVPADDEVVAVFTDATQVTWFEDDGDIYRVAATPRLPGRSC